MKARPLIQFETPVEGLRVKCECGGETFYIALHIRLTTATWTAECVQCGRREPFCAVG